MKRKAKARRKTGECQECGGTGLKWFRLPDDVGSPYAVPCPRGCPPPPVATEVAWEACPDGGPPGGAAAEPPELRGRITICIPHNSDGSESVEIRVEDELSGAAFAEVRVGLAEFAKALASRCVGCAFRLRGLDVVGRRREHKTVEIRHPCPDDYGRERDGLLRGAVAPHEVDGWAGDIEDFRNRHNRDQSGVRRAGEEVYRIGFSRYVDPEGPAVESAPRRKADRIARVPAESVSNVRAAAGPGKSKKKAYRRKCHKCGTRRATQHTEDPYLSELRPKEPNPKRFWCDHCLSESARDI